MKIKDVTKLTGVKENALRFYEKKELLHPKRNHNGYREYQEKDIQKIMMIQLYRSMGFSILQIKQLFYHKKQQNQIELFFEQQAFLNQKIKELTMIREGITACLDQTLQDACDSQEKTMEILRQTQSNMMLEKSWKDAWNFDEWAKEYDEVVANAATALPFYVHYEDVLHRCATLVNAVGGSVLEIGIGTGNLLARLQGNSVFGIDQSIQMLMLTKKKYPNIPVRLGTFLNIPFEANDFDCIVNSYAFHHNNQVEKQLAIMEMDRVLRPSGSIVLCDLMFENNQKRNEYERKCSKEALEELKDEYFANIDEVVNLFESIQYTCCVEQLDELIWIVHAKRNKQKN